MNPLHTQGDWVCIDGNIFSDGFTTETPIARVFKRKSPHVTLANARLIAASPELLDALVMALESLDAAEVPQEWDCRKSVRSAIAKATGSAA